MALTADQQAQFERFGQELLNAAIGGDKDSQATLVKWTTKPSSNRLSMFRAWATTERAREAQAEQDADTRVARERTERTARDTILAEIETLTRL